MTDTSPIKITIIISGQIEDSFIVDEYRVNKHNDKKTSFQKVGEISTRVTLEMTRNAQSGYIINPGIYFATGNGSDVSYPPQQSGQTIIPPIDCASVASNPPITINELFW